MAHKLVRILSFFVASLVLVGCTFVSGSGTIESETRAVSDFRAVTLTGSGAVTIQQGDAYSLVVEADDNILPLIETEVNGDTLHIGFRAGTNMVNPSRTIQYRITAPNVDEITISGSGTVRADTIVAERFSATISGSGELEIDALTVADLRIGVSGSGDVQVAGAAQTQQIRVSGSGAYVAGDLASESAEMTITGSGDATVWVAERLDVSVSGSGNVAYYGSPSVDQQTSGSGRVRSLGNK